MAASDLSTHAPLHPFDKDVGLLSYALENRLGLQKPIASNSATVSDSSFQKLQEDDIVNQTSTQCLFEAHAVEVSPPEEQRHGINPYAEIIELFDGLKKRREARARLLRPAKHHSLTSATQANDEPAPANATQPSSQRDTTREVTVTVVSTQRLIDDYSNLLSCYAVRHPPRFSASAVKSDDELEVNTTDEESDDD